jgi:hypothetical protein
MSVVPPPARPPASEKESGSFKRLFVRFIRSPYVLIALAVHLLLLVSFGGRVAFKGMQKKGQFEAGDVFVATSGDLPPPPPPMQQPPPDETVPVPTQMATTPNDLIASDVLNPNSFSMPDAAPVIAPEVSAMAKAAPPPPPPKNVDNFAKRAAAVREFTKSWSKDGKSGPTGTGKSTQAKFVCHIAKATGINPAIYHQLDATQQIVGGPIPNLLRMINAWSNGRIEADSIPKPLDLASQEIFTAKPPFIYFAGFSDFKLSDVEVENLRKYLVSGGAIWGDNGLAGRGSRFDIAFRREMKRVIPDDDKVFEEVPLDNPIFRGDKAFFQLSKLPPGMNYRDDRVEAIRLDGEVAVLYTLNDYTDMMCMGFEEPILQAKNQPERFHGPKIYWRTGRMESVLWPNRDNYFRNFEPESCEDVFKLGINIVVHLLTRFQEKLMFPS